MGAERQQGREDPYQPDFLQHSWPLNPSFRFVTDVAEGHLIPLKSETKQNGLSFLFRLSNAWVVCLSGHHVCALTENRRRQQIPLG